MGIFFVSQGGEEVSEEASTSSAILNCTLPRQTKLFHTLPAMPAAVFTGGARSVVIEASPALLAFFDVDSAAVLRTVASDLRGIVADYRWDSSMFVYGATVEKWRACFPRAQSANLEDEDVPADAFVHFRSLVELSLTRSQFSVRALVANEFPRLTRLDLTEDTGYTLNDETRRRLLDVDLAALQCPLLTDLTLGGCDDITGMTLHFPLLTNLSLTFSGITNAGLGAMQCPVLLSLDLANSEGIMDLGGLQCPRLNYLNLSGCENISDIGLGALCCPLLTRLNVGGCSGITDAGLRALQCTGLTTLEVRASNITDAGLGTLQFPLLRTINLSMCSRITDSGLGMLQCPLLTTLSIGGCSAITDSGLAMLRCSLLVSLDLSCCSGITDTGLSVLKSPLLTSLDLLGCSGITDAGLAALKCPLLTNICVWGCTNITDAGLVALQRGGVVASETCKITAQDARALPPP
jgi:hypothetical protein